MKLSFYAHEADAFPKERELSEAEVFALLTTHSERAIKEGPAWSPAIIGCCPPECRNTGAKTRKCSGDVPHRHERNVLGHSLVVFDIDHEASAEAERIINHLKELGLKAAVHSSHSHQAPLPEAKAKLLRKKGLSEEALRDNCCLRVILFPDRVIAPAEVKTVRAALVEALSLTGVDGSTKDLSRLYYLPAHPAEREPFVWSNPEGECFEVAPLLAADVAAANGAALGLLALKQQPANPVDLNDLRTRLKNIPTNNPEAKAVVKRVLAGEPLAEYGAHDATMNELAGVLATYLPEGTPFESVVHLCELSLRRMEWTDGWEDCLNAFEEKYERAVERVTSYRAERKAEMEAFKATLRLGLAAKTTDPLAAEEAEDGSGKYSARALAEWNVGQQEWIIQKKDSFFVFVNGKYVCRSKEELPNCIHRDLLRAPLALEVETQKGPRELTPSELIRAYGTVAEAVEASLVIQRGRYDAKTGVYHEAVAPLRRLEPEYDPQVQRWLELLGGKDADRLLDWVATVTDLSRQTCAVYIWGPKGIGKTTFAVGLSRLWTTGAPAGLKQAFADFNDAVAKCPLIFADEKVPKRDSITEDLRELIGVSERQLARKFRDASSLNGAVRLVIVGNNPDLIKPTNDMSRYDLEATAERILYIEATKDVTEYLEAIGGQPVAESWMKEDKLAKHALWLKANRVVNTSGRFLVAGYRKTFHEKLAVNSGVGQQVCEVIVKQLVSTRPLSPNVQDFLVYGNSELFVNVKAIELLWEDHIKTNDRFGLDRLAKALASLAHEQKTLTNARAKKQIRYNRVNVKQLYAWAESSGIADPEELKATIDKPNAQVAEWLERLGGPVSAAGAA